MLEGHSGHTSQSDKSAGNVWGEQIIRPTTSIGISLVLFEVKHTGGTQRYENVPSENLPPSFVCVQYENNRDNVFQKKGAIEKCDDAKLYFYE